MPLKNNKPKQISSADEEAASHLNFTEKEEEFTTAATGQQQTGPDLDQQHVDKDLQEHDADSRDSRSGSRDDSNSKNEGAKRIPRKKNHPQRGFDIL